MSSVARTLVKVSRRGPRRSWLLLGLVAVALFALSGGFPWVGDRLDEIQREKDTQAIASLAEKEIVLSEEGIARAFAQGEIDMWEAQRLYELLERVQEGLLDVDLQAEAEKLMNGNGNEPPVSEPSN
ncbi:hypothetical protein JW710_02490 [Candidatus Dojkabacteria bacterium]|nr:hypothetical protein [Candidatus Dojkabacteria bacterium]